MSAAAPWWARYVGLPFGEGPGEVTCWSLIVRVFAEVRGVALPAFGDIPPADLHRVAREMDTRAVAALWRAVDPPPEAFDVVRMRSGQGRVAVVHVGLMLDGARMLHVEEASATVVVPVAHPLVAPRIVDFRRYCG